MILESCKNQNFKRRNYAKIELFYTGSDRGWGVRALEEIPENVFLIEYVGEVMNGIERRRRSRKMCKSPYVFKLAKSVYIDAMNKGNLSRFINHCCDANAEAEVWEVDEEKRLGIFSKKHISKGEEITIFYEYNRPTAEECRCGSENCKKVF